MADKFTKQAADKLDELVKERAKVRELEISLTAQIISLQTFVSTATDDTPEARVLRRARLQEMAEKMKERNIPKYRGKKITTVLDILKDAPMALDLDTIINLAAERGIAIDRASLRSQLAKAERIGRVENRGGLYVYVDIDALEDDDHR